MRGSQEQSAAVEAGSPFPGMIWVEGGSFRMGSDAHYPEEGPARQVLGDGLP